MNFGGLEEDGRFTKMPALGRRFQMGDFYNYRTDKIVAEGPIFWEPSDLESSIRSLKKFVPLLDIMAGNKWQNMDIEFSDHLQMSIMAGIIDNYSGAGHYLNHRSSPSEVTRTLICRVQSDMKSLNIGSLIKKTISKRFYGNVEMLESVVPDATHIVVGAIYGAEAYCVLSKKPSDEEVKKDNPEVTEEYLHEILLKMWLALEEEKSLVDFEKKLKGDERQMIAHLYADFQDENVRVCDIPAAYQQCLATIKKAKGDPIPVVVLLYPLKELEALAGDLADTYEYRDVGGEAFGEMLDLYTELERVIAEVDAAYDAAQQANQTTIAVSFEQFREAILKYREMVKVTLKEAVMEARKTDDGDSVDDDVEEVCDIVEFHSLFKSSRLERWLSFKKTELEIAVKVKEVNGAAILDSRDQLEEELGKKKYSIVLTVPPLDELTRDILDAMKEYVTEYTKVEDGDQLGGDDSKEEKDGTPWHKLKCKQKHVLAKIDQLVHYGKKTENQVQFIIVLNKDAKEDFFSIYEEGKLVADKLDRLVGPPKQLRFVYQAAESAASSSSFLIEWDQEEFVYPCQFVVEFRLKGCSDQPWEQQKTGDPWMIVKGGSPMEVRVAVETCIGFSNFAVIFAATPADEKARQKKEKEKAEVAASRDRQQNEALQSRVNEFMENEIQSLRTLGLDV